MYANGFFEQRTRSPASLGIVIVLHAAALAAVILAGTTRFITEAENRTIVIDVNPPREPPPVPPPQRRDDRRPVETERQRVQATEPVGPANDNTAETTNATERTTGTAQTGERTIDPPRQPDPPAPPVRREAELDPRYAGDLQPPYPASEIRAQRGGTVRIRLSIGADGRVRAVERLAATSDAFWEATQRQARRWRFRPATLDGRPVEGVKVMNVRFRIEDA